MTEDIRGRTIGQFPLVDADTINPATARVPIWREEQPDGNRIAAITPDELRQLVADGLLDKAEADLLYAPIGVVAASGAVRIPFGFGDATPKTLGAFGPGLLARVSIVIETAFNGAPSALSIGTATQPALYLPVAANDPSKHYYKSA